MDFEKAIDHILTGADEFTADELVGWMGVSAKLDLPWVIEQFTDDLIISHSLRLDIQEDGTTLKVVMADDFEKDMALARAVNSSMEQ